jgi:hypothetical protein
MSNVDWAALEQLQAAGLTEQQVYALGGGQAPASSAPPSTPSTVTGTDSLGLPSLNAPPNLLPNLPPNATTAQIEAAAMARYNADPALQAYIKNTYGYIGAYLLSVPELLPILVAAGLGGLDPGRMDAAVVQTNWWKTTSQAQRNFQEIQANNPGEAAAQVAQMQNTILATAQQLGVTIPADQLKNMATMATAFNWSTATIEQTLRAGGAFSAPNPKFGAAATFQDQARQLAGEYNINLSDSQMQAYVKQNVAGTLSADGLQSMFAQQAEQMYPWMAASIKQGVTPSQYLSSYASAAGTTLGIDPSSVNWTDPKWNKALLTTNAQGQQQPNSIGVFQQNLMKDPTYGYQYTNGARDQAYGTAQTILQTFGKVGK